jgi:hypothetical protein
MVTFTLTELTPGSRLHMFSTIGTSVGQQMPETMMTVSVTPSTTGDKLDPGRSEQPVHL